MSSYEAEVLETGLQPPLPGTIPPLPTAAERHEQFLVLLEEGCRVNEAAKAAGICTSEAYRKRRTDPAYAERWAVARKVRLDTLVAEAKRRALRGSDRLMEFLLCNLDPQTFSRREKLEVTGSLDIVSRLVAARRRVGNPQGTPENE